MQISSTMNSQNVNKACFRVCYRALVCSLIERVEVESFADVASRWWSCLPLKNDLLRLLHATLGPSLGHLLLCRRPYFILMLRHEKPSIYDQPRDWRRRWRYARGSGNIVKHLSSTSSRQINVWEKVHIAINEALDIKLSTLN